MSPLFIWLLLSFVTPSFAAAQNYSIDDTSGDERTTTKPTYLGDWEVQGTPVCGCMVSVDCPPCLLPFGDSTHSAATVVDQSQLRPRITFNFTGSAIYIFFVPISIDTRINIGLDLDEGTDVTLPFASRGVAEASLVYCNETLPFGDHMIVLTGITEGMVFDYALYTYHDDLSPVPFPALPSPPATGQVPMATSQPSSTSSPSFNSSDPPPNLTTEATIGLLIFIILVVVTPVIITLLRRRARRRKLAAEAMASWVIDDLDSPYLSSVPLPSTPTHSTAVSTQHPSGKLHVPATMHDTQRSLQNEIDTLRRQMSLMRRTSQPRDVEAGLGVPRTSYSHSMSPPPSYHRHSLPQGFGVLGRVSRRVTTIIHGGNP
ncbi:hypothetical protein DL96DRAFT_1711662 [Flagelloscypha sp. PMI_526]|nr:hypothetical protein DL96DRAFT_1711662 [Flagelloscypha sp. PMI_526]